MRSNKVPTVVKVLIFLMFAGFIIAGRVFIEREIEERLEAQRKIFPPAAPSPEVLRWISMGDDGAVAMSLWLQILPYLGELAMKHKMKEMDWQFFSGSLSSVITLDKYFYDSYLVAVNVLANNPKFIHVSNYLAAKGVEARKDKWDIPFFLAFNYYFLLNDFEKALYYYDIAASRPGVPFYVKDIAATLWLRKGDYIKAIEILEEAVKNENTPEVFRLFMEKELQNVKNILIIEKAVKAFKQDTGRYPKTLDELVLKGYLEEIPKHPFGRTYSLDTETGKVKY